MTRTKIPEFSYLVNYPCHMGQLPTAYRDNNFIDSSGKEIRRCVMCGEIRILAPAPKSKESRHTIPKQNKGVCTACDTVVWVITDSGIDIKWCKGCKNFRPWATFGDKGLATKCVRCRDKQREQYMKRVQKGAKNMKSSDKESNKGKSIRKKFEAMMNQTYQMSSIEILPSDSEDELAMYL